MASTNLEHLDEKALRELLDVAPDYDERCRIRAAIRHLKPPINATTTTTRGTTRTSPATSTTTIPPTAKDRKDLFRSSTFTSALPSVRLSGDGNHTSNRQLHQPDTQAVRSNSFNVKNNGDGIAQRRWGKHIGNGNGGKSENVSVLEKNRVNVFKKSGDFGRNGTESSQSERIMRDQAREESTEEKKKVEKPQKDVYSSYQDAKEISSLLEKQSKMEARGTIRTVLRQLSQKDEEEEEEKKSPRTSSVSSLSSSRSCSQSQEPESRLSHEYESQTSQDSEPQVFTETVDFMLTGDTDKVTESGQVPPWQQLKKLKAKLKSQEEQLGTCNDFDLRRKIRAEMREIRAQVKELKEGITPDSLLASTDKDALPLMSVEITTHTNNGNISRSKDISKPSLRSLSTSSSSPETPPVEPDFELRIIEPLLNLMAVDGEPATLECQLQAPPGVNIKWYKDGKLLLTSKDFEQTFDGKTAKLTIGEVFPDDEGCYLCTVETPSVTVETSANIVVRENQNLVIPEFLELPRDLNVVEGGSVSLQCVVSGTPAPEVTWYMGRKVLPNNDIYEQRFDGKTARLVIEDSELGDQGMYKCIARNKAGEVKCTCRVRVTAKDSHPSISEEEEYHGLLAPHITRGLDSKLLTEGQDVVVLSCEVTGNPQPSVTWYKDDVALARGLRVSQTYEGKVATLKVRDIRKTDGGEYSCTARNERGDAGTTAMLTVRGKATPNSSPQKISAAYMTPTPGGSTGRKMGALEAMAANLKEKIRREPPKFLDPNKDPYEGYDLTPISSEEENEKMADISQIDDEEVLHKMMNKTDNFEERKRIRARLRDIRESSAAKFESGKGQRESAVEMRQRLAGQEKERKMQQFAEEAKDGRKESNVMEEEKKRKRAEADAAKQAELEKMKEMGKTMAQAHHAGHDIVTRAEKKGRNVLEGKDSNEDTVFSSTKTEKGPDGRLTTTTSTTTQKTKGENITQSGKGTHIVDKLCPFPMSCVPLKV